MADIIERDLDGRVLPEPFRYLDLGTMATISSTDDVAQRGRIRLSGPIAKVGWAAVHLAFLVGWGNRVAVLTEWLQATIFGSRRGQAIITNPYSKPDGDRGTSFPPTRENP